MKYADITDDTEKKRALQRSRRQAHLYASIFRDISAILKVMLPSDKAMTAGLHIKSVMYALIELRTGKKPDKF